jgi:hypothetical protein
VNVIGPAAPREEISEPAADFGMAVEVEKVYDPRMFPSARWTNSVVARLAELSNWLAVVPVWPALNSVFGSTATTSPAAHGLVKVKEVPLIACTSEALRRTPLR